MTSLSDAIDKTKNFFAPGSRAKMREEDVIKHFGNMFSPEKLDELTWSKFETFFSEKNNHHWSNLIRSKRYFNKRVDELIPALKVLLDESIDITERLELTIPPGAKYKASGSGPGIYTPILMFVYPDRYAIFNGPVTEAINKLKADGILDLGIPKVNRDHFIEVYKRFNDFAVKFAKENGLTTWELDWMWAAYTDSSYVPNLKYDNEPFFQEEGIRKVQSPLPTTEINRLDLPLNIILYGPVGTGKTTVANALAKGIISKEIQTFGQVEELAKNSGNFKLLFNSHSDFTNKLETVTFHKSYGYEQFIEGIKPEKNKDGSLAYDYNSGIFKDISNRAKEALKQDITSKFVLIIDEINRGDISRIFGELITLVEEDKRYYGESQRGMSITLPYTKKDFSVPGNLFIIGTMNTTDKSIALIDLALRRRFYFIEIPPNPNKLKEALDEYGTEDRLKKAIIQLFVGINEQLMADDKEEFGIGQAYFIGISNEVDFLRRWNYKILPLLEEYYYDDKNSLVSFLGNIFKDTGETWDLKRNIRSYEIFKYADKFIDSIMSK